MICRGRNKIDIKRNEISFVVSYGLPDIKRILNCIINGIKERPGLLSFCKRTCIGVDAFCYYVGVEMIRYYAIHSYRIFGQFDTKTANIMCDWLVYHLIEKGYLKNENNEFVAIIEDDKSDVKFDENMII